MPATTIDHAPARACFYRRQWPEGLEFPCCFACNQATKVSEQVVALYVRIADFDEKFYDFDALSDLYSAVRNNAPDLLPHLDVPTRAKRNALKDIGASPLRGRDHNGCTMFGAPVGLKPHMDQFAHKLLCAIHYRELEKPIALGTPIWTIWLQRLDPRYPMLIDIAQNTYNKKVIGDRPSAKDLRKAISYVCRQRRGRHF